MKNYETKPRLFTQSIARKFLINLFFIVVCLQTLGATTTSTVFAKYPNKYFIESGTFQGDGVSQALAAGFEKIYSIELSDYYYRHSSNRFAQFPAVTLFKGDSGKMLTKVLKRIDAPATFWLDGHYTQVDHAAKADKLCPIMAELDCIGKHPIKTHTILIDDVRCFGTEHFDFITLDEVIQKLLEINPDYQISFEDGFVPNDVLVAHYENRFNNG